MQPIEALGEINICFAVDDNYAPYLKVTINSIISNCDRNRKLDIIVLCKGLSDKNMETVKSVSDNNSNVSIRFVDVSETVQDVSYSIGGYLTEATMYRLFILSDLFKNYDRIIYLDADTIVEGDISELFFTDMDGKPVAAVEDTGLRQLAFSKRAVFIDGRIPYSINGYKKNALEMKSPECYFNAGVILFDLKKYRERHSFEEVLAIKEAKHYFYNDQDILNILFDAEVYMLDFGWNYQNNIDGWCKMRPEVYESMFADARREHPMIIHYVSAHKPWNDEVTWGEIYNKYK